MALAAADAAPIAAVRGQRGIIIGVGVAVREHRRNVVVLGGGRLPGNTIRVSGWDWAVLLSRVTVGCFRLGS